MKNKNSFSTASTLNSDGKSYHFHSLKLLAKKTGKDLSRLPFSLKVLLENLLRYEDDMIAKKSDIESLLAWNPKAEPDTEIQFVPARTILQDFTGVPAVADLAAMRGAIEKLGGDPSKVNPLSPSDLVIDHSVQVDYYGTADSAQKNTDIEFKRNGERYEFLRWGQSAFKNFRVVPPSTGIVHQVNLEYLAQVAMTKTENNEHWVYPDSLVGTDSHTTMINGLGVLGWGVGGIEAEASMLGQPITMLIPQVVGFKLSGKLPAGATATDLVLTVTQMLRKKGVVGKFVEFFGPGLSNLTLADRATIANMAPEYGATVGIFPVDEKTTDYLELTGRSQYIPLVKTYFQEQGMWFDSTTKDAEYSDVLNLDLNTIEPCLAGPSRPQDRIKLSDVKASFESAVANLLQKDASQVDLNKTVNVNDSSAKTPYQIGHGSVVIAAITSCTNTSNPAGLIAAGLLAKNATAKGLKTKPWVKTSLAPGSKVVTDYLKNANLLSSLESLGFNLVGYGCTTCIGNSGPIKEPISSAITEGGLAVSAVLSGNRNFEGRIHAQVRGNYLASPALVVAYAIAGSTRIDLSKEPLGNDSSGNPVYLKDIWPSNETIAKEVLTHVNSALFTKSYSDVFKGSIEWQNIKFPKGDLYKWDQASSYIKEPPFFQNMPKEPNAVADVKGAYVLALLGDSVTTDHISPAGNISKSSPAARYLLDLGVKQEDFNSYGSRRGNHEVMMRGTFANIRLKNFLVPGTEGGITKHIPTGKQTSIFEASMQYQADGQSLIILAGKEYGTGSSRDWAAKGTMLLGVRTVIAESFERIHRSNLIGMGVLPLQFAQGESAKSLELTGEEKFDILGLASIKPSETVTVQYQDKAGSKKTFKARCRIDTPNELEYFKHGGILQYVLRQMLKGK